MKTHEAVVRRIVQLCQMKGTTPTESVSYQVSLKGR